MLKIFKDFTKVGFSNYISQIMAALMSFLLARWLGPVDFGVFSIGFYILTIFGLGFTGFDQSYVSFTVQFSKKEEEIFSTYAALKIVLAFIVIILFAMFCLLPLPWGSSCIRKSMILYGLIGGLGMNILMIGLSYFQSKEQFDNYSRIRLIYYVVLLFLLFIGIQLEVKEVNYYLLIYIAPVFFLLQVFRKLKFSIFKFQKDIAQRLWKLGSWLILSHFVRLVNLRIDFFWLSRYFKGEILGQYSAALRLVNIFVLLIGTFSVLILPKASAIKTIKQFKEYWFENIWIMAFLLISWTIVYFLSPYIIGILYGVQYKEANLIFRMLLYSVIPLIFSLPMKYIFLGMGKTFYLFLVFVIQGLSLILFIPFLASKFGLEGVVYGRIISFFISFISYFIIYIFIKKRLLINLVFK